MKQITLTNIHKFGVTETTKPKIINDNDVLLKINTVGVCGSDIHYFTEGRIGDQVINFPFTIGHECSAIVEQVGKNVKRVKPGDLVAVEPTLSCHKCEQCLSGREHTCLNQKFLGCPGQIDGCLTEYIVMPERNCFPVPDNLNSEMTALVEPLSIGYYAAQFIKDMPAEKTVAILGAGPIGLSVMISLRSMSFKQIYVTDKLDYRLTIAQKAGASWIGNPDKQNIVSDLKKVNSADFDAAFECCGKQEAIDEAVQILKPGGKLLIVGIPEVDRISFNISKIRRKEISIQNVRRQNHSVQPVIDLVASGKISPEFMITHRYTPDQTQEAFDTVSQYKDGVIKALIKF